MNDVLRPIRTGAHKVRRETQKLARKALRKPLVPGALATVVAILIGVGVYVGAHGFPEWKVAMPQSIPLLKPSPVALAHVSFEAGKKGEAIKTYDTALTADVEAADEKMVGNLVSAFGTKEQAAAAAVIVRHKLVQTEPGLQALTSNHRYGARWGAVRTLERLGKAPRESYVNAWIQDLKEERCELRQVAMENLGKAGDRRALASIRAARKKDEANRGFLGLGGCLGGRPEDAEKRILARK